MYFNNKHFYNIVKANNDNRLAIFIGAGISKSSESTTLSLPSWTQLIDELKIDLGLQDENDFLKIAQLYFLQFGEYVYYEKLKGYFPDNIEPSIIHKLLFELNPQYIITTNWDTILEKTIEDNAYIYDTISSDKDLVKSTLQKKLIKMHGDFKQHNIVFKEDDYLNYQYNFPLIENYIKSILSTHTVLFLGYSYNDINLKQIITWIQNNSKVNPPRYLILFQHNPIQEKYLENHSIKTLIMDEIYDEKYDDLDKYSKKIATFLDLLNNPVQIEKEQNDDEVVEYIYKKLKILNNLDGILLEQIEKILTNCGFMYTEDSLILLEFYSQRLTIDIDTKERQIHKKFVEILKKYDKNEYLHGSIDKIFAILIKANIDGIIISEDMTHGAKEYVHFKNMPKAPLTQKIIDSCFNFDFNILFEKTNDIQKMTEFAYHYYQLNSYHSSYSFLEEIITLCLKQRNYTQLFLSMFNRNILLKNLKYFDIEKDNDKFKHIKEYDLQEKFNNLPKDLQNALEPIYNFVNFDYLYRYAFNISRELKKKEKAKESIEKGALVFQSDVMESELKHKNLVLFLLQNKIMIENYEEYQIINKYFIEISIIRQSQNDITKLNQIELYSCIKYIKEEELDLLLNKFYSTDLDKKNYLTISEENKKWLLENVLPNISNIFINAKSLTQNHAQYLYNLIFLLSLIKLDKDQIKIIMDTLFNTILVAKNTLGIYESMNKFLYIQFTLYKSKIDDTDLINIIEMIINKLICKNYNGYDYHAISSNSIQNVYGYMQENKYIFTNKNLITKLLLELKEFSIDEKIKLSQSLLIKIYQISNIDIQEKIKTFILDTNKEQTNNNLVFELFLLIYSFKDFDIKLVKQLDTYLEQYKDGKNFSGILYTFKSQLDYLVHKMGYKPLKKILNKTNLYIKNFKTKKMISIF